MIRLSQVFSHTSVKHTQFLSLPILPHALSLYVYSLFSAEILSNGIYAIIRHKMVSIFCTVCMEYKIYSRNSKQFIYTREINYAMKLI